MPSLFWGTLILGRILAPIALRYFAEAKLVVAGLLVTTLGIVILLVSKSLMSVFIGVSLAGLGLSPVFPITIATLTQCSDATTSRLAPYQSLKAGKSFGDGLPRGTELAAPMFAFGGLGGACLPWLVGFLSSQFDSLRVGLMIPLLATLLILALQSLTWTTGKRAAD